MMHDQIKQIITVNDMKDASSRLWSLFDLIHDTCFDFPNILNTISMKKKCYTEKTPFFFMSHKKMQAHVYFCPYKTK